MYILAYTSNKFYCVLNKQKRRIRENFSLTVEPKDSRVTLNPNQNELKICSASLGQRGIKCVTI